jgi:thiol-disulfide isomerase/thioredoxin
MKYFLFIILFFVVNFANAQVKLLTLNQLEKRVAQGIDTTFVINFWATWCQPCVKELPNFEQLQLNNKEKPVKVILVSLDFKSKLKSQVIPFVKQNNIKAEVYLINEADQQAFIEKLDKQWTGAIPATLFINTKSKKRLFFEKEFNYQELNKTLAAIK